MTGGSGTEREPANPGADPANRPRRQRSQCKAGGAFVRRARIPSDFAGPAKYCAGFPGLPCMNPGGFPMKRMFAAMLLFAGIGLSCAESAVQIPAPVVDEKPAAGKLQTAV